jgi:glucose-6-phosphate 1-dehydrogenase
MEPPVSEDFDSVQTEKVKVFRAMRALQPDDLVRGQYTGYREAPGVARDSDVETFCALRLFIDSWRWEGVPWYLRSGKYLPKTVNEILVQLKPPPHKLFDDSPRTVDRANYFRFQLSPLSTIALAGRVKSKGKQFVGDQKELSMIEAECGERLPYERLLEDAMSGDRMLFTREDTVDAAWAVVDRVLKNQPRTIPYPRGSWGPKEAEALIAEEGGWHNPAWDPSSEAQPEDAEQRAPAALSPYSS